VVIGVHAELAEWSLTQAEFSDSDDNEDVEDDDSEDVSSVDVVSQADARIVSRWREVSANEKHEMRQDVDEILQPLGSETRLVVMERVSGIAFLFICMTLAAVMNLRNHWRSRKLRDIVKKLFTVLSRATRTFYINRLTWPLTQFELQSSFFSPVPG